MDSVTKPTLFGRRSELGVIAQFLDEVPRRSSALVLVGEAGIGKTTLWEAGVESASTRGWLVLQARPGASETTMTFAALGDLLDPVVDEVLDEIPSMQRSALRTALLRAAPGDDQVSDQRAVALGTLGALAPWLEAVRFCLRSTTFNGSIHPPRPSFASSCGDCRTSPSGCSHPCDPDGKRKIHWDRPGRCMRARANACWFGRCRRMTSDV